MRGLMVALSAAFAAGAVAAAEEWRLYENARFGTVLEVPTSLTPSPSPQNGDGLTSQSSDGRTRVVVYAGFSETRSESWDDYRQRFRRMLLQNGAVLTEAAEEDNTFTYSGRLGDGLFFLRVNRSRRCPDIAHHLEFAYPAADRAARAAWVRRLGRTLGEAASAECE